MDDILLEACNLGKNWKAFVPTQFQLGWTCFFAARHDAHQNRAARVFLTILSFHPIVAPPPAVLLKCNRASFVLFAVEWPRKAQNPKMSYEKFPLLLLSLSHSLSLSFSLCFLHNEVTTKTTAGGAAQTTQPCPPIPIHVHVQDPCALCHSVPAALICIEREVCHNRLLYSVFSLPPISQRERSLSS